jgi:hypothetical protein
VGDPMSITFISELFVPILATALVFGPGLLLAVMFFPGQSKSWQISLGMGLAVVIIGWLGLLLSLLPVGVTFLSIVIGLLMIGGGEAIFFWAVRRRGLRNSSDLFPILRDIRRENVLSLLVFIGFLMTLIVGLPLAQKNNEQGYTEFFLAEGFLKNPPWRRAFNATDTVSLTFVVKSNEKAAESFEVHVVTEGEISQVFKLGILYPGHIVKQSIKIVPLSGSMRRYDLVLYKGRSTMPYRSLHFWLQTQLD